MAIDSVTPWMERPFQVTRVTAPPHPGLVTAAVPLQGGPVRACFACSVIVQCEGSGWVGGLNLPIHVIWVGQESLSHDGLFLQGECESTPSGRPDCSQSRATLVDSTSEGSLVRA